MIKRREDNDDFIGIVTVASTVYVEIWLSNIGLRKIYVIPM